MMASSNANPFSVTGHLCHRWLVNSPHKGQWRGTLMFSLICSWINGWVNNGEAGDLRRHHAHHNVTVMIKQFPSLRIDSISLLVVNLVFPKIDIDNSFPVMVAKLESTLCQHTFGSLDPVLLLLHYALSRYLGNGSPAMNETWVSIGWKDGDSDRLL